MSKRSLSPALEVVKVVKKVKKEPSTPFNTPEKSTPPPVVEKQRRVGQLSRVLLGRVVAQVGYGTPVKQWPKSFWSVRKNLYEECEVFRPATPVKIYPH